MHVRDGGAAAEQRRTVQVSARESVEKDWAEWLLSPIYSRNLLQHAEQIEACLPQSRKQNYNRLRFATLLWKKLRQSRLITGLPDFLSFAPEISLQHMKFLMFSLTQG